VTLPEGFAERVEAIVGSPWIRRDAESRLEYGTDALRRGRAADLVALPGDTREIAALARLCTHQRVPLVVRGGGTGYTGGSVPVAGGLVVALDRLNRIIEIDEENLLAVVEPNVVTGDLQDAVERVGLFYPPDPASLRQSVIGGNVAEGAGGPRAFKYGTTKRYVLGLEAVLPTGEVVRTGSKAVKNVVGYDLTQLLVGSEGTLAILTRIVLRLIPKPPVQVTLRACFGTIETACRAASELIARRVVPATIELVDRASLDAVSRKVGQGLAPRGTGALLIIEVDGFEAGVGEEVARVEEACRRAGALEMLRADDAGQREALWQVRRELSLSLRAIAGLKINHDVVVPRGRIPQLFTLIDRLRTRFALTIACFGHAGDGNIHVNLLVDPADAAEMTRAHQAERELFEGVVSLEGSISGEHGIGFSKSEFLGIELGCEEIALMRRIKAAFDPAGILNPGKIFPAAMPARTETTENRQPRTENRELRTEN
jgi:glycolate oxidase